ncbi:8486_t:CDS:2 [Cetraspora pellucida]|uniref:8486_t:CDS:1 n=1 Tax=Cetraspora pellucida TaxID=1433469 RepID=A0A9N9A5H9_9GLOM|nr:8486_t:CDS:2 [Cetraspora pellucida]
MEKTINSALVETKKCTRCNCDRPLVDFLSDKDIYSGCKTCCNNHIYNSLLSNKDVDDDFAGQMRFQLEFNINSESIDETLVDIEQNKNLSIANLVINKISNGDGYSYVHQSIYNNNYEPLTINSNSIININEIPITNSAIEINNGSVDIVEQKHNQLCQILNESKVLHNQQKFLDNMEEKLIPLNKLVEDILHHEKRRTLP